MRTIDKLSPVIVIAPLVVAVLAGRAASQQPTYPLRSRRAPGAVDRVETAFEVGGELKEIVEGKVHRAKISVTCNLSYDEKTLELTTTPQNHARSVRYYEQIDAVIKVEDDGMKPVLRQRRRLIGAEASEDMLTLFSPLGPLTRDELDLIDVLPDSLLLDRLLPEKRVAVGDSWKHSPKLIAALLGIDVAGTANVRSTLTEVAGGAARFGLTGRVEGAIEGVSTEIELKAKYRFDLKRGRIDWFALLVKEDRSIGHVADGVDAVARRQMQIAPLADSPFFEALTEFLKTSENRVRWKVRFATPEMYQDSVKSYYRLISGVDRVVGRIVEKLRRRGVDQQTIILYTGDNGFYLGERGFAGKWFPHEVSIRVPLVIYDPRLPAERHGTRREEMALSIDLAPTMLDMAGVAVPDSMQGKSLVPLVRGEKPPWRTEFFYEHLFRHGRIPCSEAVRDETTKYIRFVDTDPPYEELYDLKSDPDEAHNLANRPEHAATLQRMRQKWAAWHERAK